MNVKLIRMSSGEDLIADIVTEVDTFIRVENAIVGVPTGQGTLAFAPWSPMISKENKEIVIGRKFIVYIAEADEQIVEQYEQMFSVISTPNKKLIM
jgi:hypothetical protein